MAWDQVTLILVTVVAAVLTGAVYNNGRLDDINRRFDDVQHRISGLREDINARFAERREIGALLEEAVRTRAGS